MPVELDGQELTGWWQIDPNTGETFDMLETGRGASMGDYALMLQTIARNAIYYFSRLGFCAYAAVTLSALIVLDVTAASYLGAKAGSGGDLSAGEAMGSAVLGGASVGTVGTMALACG